MMKIVVGIDGSDEARAAVRWTSTVAPALNAEVIAVSAFEPPPVAPVASGWLPPEDWADEWRAHLTAKLDGEWTKELRDAGLAVNVRVHEGHPADVIMDVAKDVHAGLIVVGNRGRGSVRQLFLGSVSHSLSLSAHCPVVVVPHASVVAPIAVH